MTKKLRLRIAVQKSGRLNKDSLDILFRCGLKIRPSKNELFCQGENLAIDLLLVRDDDIPILVADQICDVGIVGENILQEKKIELATESHINDFQIIKKLGFGKCRLSLAVPNDSQYESLTDFKNCRIATSYPNLLNQFLLHHNIPAETIHLAGSVEIAPRLGIAELICDLVSTGETLKANNLREFCNVLQSQAVLFRAYELSEDKNKIIETLLCRLNGVLQVQESKYIMFHIPKRKLKCIKTLLPGIETPTVIGLNADENKVVVHVVSQEGVFWETLENLKAAGASSILVLPIEKMLL